MARMTQLQKFLNSPLNREVLMGRRNKTGDLFGLELECEGKRVNFNRDGDGSILTNWNAVADGSLRDTHGQACEWVFNGPADYNKSVNRVHELFDYLDERDARFVTSNRTSTHVHFNMGDKNVYQLVNMYILFTVFEDILDRYCGEDRNGNLFCLSSRHAEAQLDWAEQMFLHQHVIHIPDNNRYCSFNMASLTKFGTVEFRGMRGLDNRQDVLDWLSILKDFTSYACYTMQNPISVVENISLKSPRGFLQEVFSTDNYDKLVAGLDDQEINKSVYEGVRLVQMMCYKIGAEFEGVRIVQPDYWAELAKQNNQNLQEPEPLNFIGGINHREAVDLQHFLRGLNNEPAF
jgi:hypothetical protein